MAEQNKPKKPKTKATKPKVKPKIKPAKVKKAAPKGFDILLDKALNFKPQKKVVKKK